MFFILAVSIILLDHAFCCRLALVILFAIALTATIVGFWLGFDRTAVRMSSSYHCLFWYSTIFKWVPSMKTSTFRCWYFFSITFYDQVYLPLNLSLGLTFLVLVIRAVHYFTQPDQREKVRVLRMMRKSISFVILPMLQIATTTIIFVLQELPYSGFVGFRERIHDANLQSTDSWWTFTTFVDPKVQTVNRPSKI